VALTSAHRRSCRRSRISSRAPSARTSATAASTRPNDEVERRRRSREARTTFIVALEKGYDTEVGEGGERLSTGQRQLVALARAVLRDPDILVMDQATSSIDTATERLVQEGVDEVLRGAACSLRRRAPLVDDPPRRC
jgi:ABC-type transport system involved in Fe-S cluster assembly fused permease/ATPase subunit